MRILELTKKSNKKAAFAVLINSTGRIAEEFLNKLQNIRQLTWSFQSVKIEEGDVLVFGSSRSKYDVDIVGDLSGVQKLGLTIIPVTNVQDVNSSLNQYLILNRKEKNNYNDFNFFHRRQQEKKVVVVANITPQYTTKTVEIECDGDCNNCPLASPVVKQNTETYSIHDSVVRIGYNMHTIHNNIFNGDRYIIVNDKIVYVKSNFLGKNYLSYS